MKQPIKYPVAYRYDNETVIIWLSPTKCFRVIQLKFFDLT